ncbi:uncharacterized protein LOC129615888 [Condylostylus longicornis]|uniref:uncharacterized protein LOC129615888 n=1 Tax=Condylostylus longicornis TaxID=2530218 RepID=UPI00244E1701|nr:uncharacterized protein LOC129615888 [Condylostylus longicornis]
MRSIQQFHITDFATDRFTPGEAVATELFKNKKKIPTNNRHPIAQASQSQKIYIPPKNIYNFPPNLESNYPGPKPYSSSPISSYIPPPAGPIEKETDLPKNQFLGPLSPEYLPYEMKKNETTDEKRMTMPEISSDSEKDNKNISDMDDHKMENAQVDDMPEQDTPPPSDLHDSHDIYPHDSHDPHDSYDIHSHDPHEVHYSHDPHEYHPHHDSHDPHEYHSHHVSHDSHEYHPHHDSHSPPDIHDISYPIHHKPHDHIPPFLDYHSYDNHPIKYNGPWNPWNNIYSSYPDIIYDHDHFHHPKETTTSAPEPPPPPPPEPEEPHTEPRVKKYSYFYLGRKLWYIPLYFTVWFSFYVLWLIVKSIARHKVNLPNHYVARDLHKRDLFSSLDEHKYKYIDELTNFVMKSIEKYQ